MSFGVAGGTVTLSDRGTDFVAQPLHDPGSCRDGGAHSRADGGEGTEVVEHTRQPVRSTVALKPIRTRSGVNPSLLAARIVSSRSTPYQFILLRSHRPATFQSATADA